MEIVIRKALLSEYTTIAEIYNQYVGQTTMDLIPVTGNYFDVYDEGNILVALEANKIVGYSLLKPYSDRLGYSIAAETSIYVNLYHQNKKIGHALQNAIMKLGKTQGYLHFVAKIWAKNTSSIRFHERFGYQLVGIQNKIGFVNGQFIDMAILQHVVDDLETNLQL